MDKMKKDSYKILEHDSFVSEKAKIIECQSSFFKQNSKDEKLEPVVNSIDEWVSHVQGELQLKEKSKFCLYRFMTKSCLKTIVKGKMKLSDPDFWEDYIDRAFFDIYKEYKGQTYFSLCFTASVNSLMWQVYGNKKDAVLVEFDGDELIKLLKEMNSETLFAPIIYDGGINRTEHKKFWKEHKNFMPFVKRTPYAVEAEWRVISPCYEINVKNNINKLIKSVTVPPKELTFKGDKSKWKTAKENIEQIVKGFDIKIRETWMFNNENLAKIMK